MADENMNETSGSSQAPSGGKMNPMMIGAVVVIAIVVIGALFFFMGRGNQAGDDATMIEQTGTSDTIESTGGAAEGSEVAVQDGDVASVTLEAGSFYYKPNVINAKIGQTVRVTINSVSMQHDFVIDELGVKSSILPSGRSETIEFVASEVGSFEFYCSVGNHKAQGMVGTLNVTQ